VGHTNGARFDGKRLAPAIIMKGTIYEAITMLVVNPLHFILVHSQVSINAEKTTIEVAIGCTIANRRAISNKNLS
jgi:hypothetical protein